MLVQLSNIVNESTHLTKNWAYIDFEDNSPEKNRLKYIYASQYPLIKNQLVKHKNNWEKNDIETFKRITLLIEDTLFKYQKFLLPHCLITIRI
ncbi:MAG: hypothetical protein IPO21_02925 [Bacteroidales bacterium]|nr:hypothetical protein [Bacteroidales bacterium]